MRLDYEHYNWRKKTILKQNFDICFFGEGGDVFQIFVIFLSFEIPQPSEYNL